MDRNPVAVEIARGRLARPRREPGAGRRPPPLVAITLDFGNTLVPVPDGALRDVVEATADGHRDRLGPFDPDDVLDAWTEERARQFREEVPRFREVDLDQRLVRILARLRGMAPPRARRPLGRCGRRRSLQRRRGAGLGRRRRTRARSSTPAAAAGRGDAARPPRARATGLAILSNWPLAATIDRYAEAAGWTPSPARDRRLAAGRDDQAPPGDLRGRRGGARRPAARAILHVGDDWAADVVGAKAGGLARRVPPRRGRRLAAARERARRRRGADLELDRLDDLEDADRPRSGRRSTDRRPSRRR